jgi:hypothetical protein
MAQPRYINILFHPSGPRSIVKFCVRFLLRFVSLFVAPIGVHTDVHHAPPPGSVFSGCRCCVHEPPLHSISRACAQGWVQSLGQPDISASFFRQSGV